MNTHANRGKRKLLHRALQSIPCAQPPQKAKAHTEAAEMSGQQPIVLLRPSGKEDKGMKAMRRLHRYRQGEQQQTILNKYKSLQLARRQLRRKSEQRLNHSIDRQHASLQKSPYLPLHLRKLPPNNSGEALLKVSNKQGRKWSFPKKIIQNAQSSDQLKQSAKNAMKRGDFKTALQCLQRAQGGTSDIQLLDLSGVCLMNLREFQQAVVRFIRVLMLDPDYSKKAYISVALCENQLNHAQRCLHYINQCISRFPDFYEAFYFKGKLLYKQQLYQQAVDILLQAASLNPHKKEIKLLIAQCYYLQGENQQALLYYQRYLGEPNSKNAKHAVRQGSLLISFGREGEGIAVLQQSLIVMEAAEGTESQKIQANYHLSLAYFRRGNYELCAMRGQEVISRGSVAQALQAIRCMLACKIIQHDYYGGIYFLRRLSPNHLSAIELKPYLQFLQGVALLMKRRSEQALGKLENLPKLLQKVDEFSVHIHRNYRLFILYGYFLEGEYSRCLKEAENQRQVFVPNYWQDTLAYIQSICKAMIDYNSHNYDKAQKQLESCLQKLPLKTQAALFLALLHMQLGARQGAQGKQRRKKICQLLISCADKFGSSSSNYSAFIFYYKGLLSAWEGEWAASAAELQLAIQKSQDNFFNFYYLRGLAVANLQNYKQAISDASLALSIVEEPQAYLLRARCLQIDGNPGQAFTDLQAFIALRPEDKQVHKFAGHLLFQNGVFEDALQAYGQGEISSDDLEVFLTRSKTYFLLGNFLKAAEDMQQAAKLTGNSPELIFDQKVMQWLASLLQRYIKNQCEDEYEFDLNLLATHLQQFKQIYKEGSQATPKYGKIFKLPEYLTLAAVCQFYLKDYSSAMDSLIEAIQLKKAALQRGEDQNQGQFEQEQAQKLVFINQMYYNLAICCCMTHDYPNAERYLRKCAISPELHNYDIYLELIDQITGRQSVEQDGQYLDLFSLRNKLSRYLPKNYVPFVSNNSDTIVCRSLKLCIPYPKVEPPQITPPFDRQLLLQIDLNQLQRRADAPWIYRQKNSIKFTQRIDVFSRFQMQKSQIGQKRPHIGSNMSGGSSFQPLPQSLREQLKLDSRLQQKLNKLIRREK